MADDTAPKPQHKEIIGYKKCCEIQDGEIVHMWWEHPTGNQTFSLQKVLAAWTEEGHTPDQWVHPKFLESKGFKHDNVIRDGVRGNQLQLVEDKDSAA